MTDIRTTEADLNARDQRIAIVASRFNEFIVESLIKGSLHALKQHGAVENDIEIIRVPGAYEMPLAVNRIAASRRYDGIVALGAVIRGGTPHFDYVAGECVRGLSAAIQVESQLYLGFRSRAGDTGGTGHGKTLLVAY